MLNNLQALRSLASLTNLLYETTFKNAIERMRKKGWEKIMQQFVISFNRRKVFIGCGERSRHSSPHFCKKL